MSDEIKKRVLEEIKSKLDDEYWDIATKEDKDVIDVALEKAIDLTERLTREECGKQNCADCKKLVPVGYPVLCGPCHARRIDKAKTECEKDQKILIEGSVANTTELFRMISEARSETARQIFEDVDAVVAEVRKDHAGLPKLSARVRDLKQKWGVGR